MPDGMRPRVSSAVLTPANVITFARLCAVPLAVWLVLHDQLAASFWLFAAAGASDAVDGWLARHYGGSRLGAMLDPVADKALIVAMYVTLAVVHVLPDWLAILVVFRDLLIVGGVILLSLLGHPAEIRPLRFSKVNTVAQIVLVGVVLGLAAFGIVLPLLSDALVWIVAATTLASGALYVWHVGRAR